MFYNVEMRLVDMGFMLFEEDIEADVKLQCSLGACIYIDGFLMLNDIEDKEYCKLMAYQTGYGVKWEVVSFIKR